MTASTPSSDERTSPWTPLSVAVFRWLWIAALVSNVGTVMHTVAAGWQATELTSSPTLIGLVQAAWTVPGFLVALPAGVLADVLDRRAVIVVTHVVSIALAGVLGALAFGHVLSVALLLLLTFLLSVAATIAAPAFMALTPELVGMAELPKAIGLNSVSMNVAQSAGPALAGLVIALGGPGAVFVVNAVTYVGIVIVVRRSRGEPTPAAGHEGFGTAVRAGVRYVVHSGRLVGLAGRLAINMAGTSSLVALLPVVARQRLHVSPSSFGLLATAVGVGAVGAVWLLPRLAVVVSPDTVATAGALIWSCGAVVVGTTTSIGSALGGLVLAGAGTMAVMNTIFSTYTLVLPSWVRGRASSIAMLSVWLGASAGAAAWGALASATGVARCLLVAAGVHAALALGARVVLPIGQPPTTHEAPTADELPIAGV
jgi:MFS family permease